TRTLAFSTLVLGNLALILSRRAGSLANHAMWVVVAGASSVMALILSWPPLRGLFSLALPDLQAAAVCALAGALLWPALMLIRYIGSGGLRLDSPQATRPAEP